MSSDGVKRPAVALGLGLCLACLASIYSSEQIVADLEREPFGLVHSRDYVDTQETFYGELVPRGPHPRAQVWLDGQVQDDAVDERGRIELEGLSAGHHHLEVREGYRGGRVLRIADSVIRGPFEPVPPKTTSCDLGVQLTGFAVDDLVVPMLSQRLLQAVHGVDVLGPKTEIEHAKLTLAGDSVGFSIGLASHNRLVVAGTMRVRTELPRKIELELASLDKVVFTGSLRQKVDIGGATIGALVTGPFAPIGAVAGYYLADRYVERRAREEVERVVKTGLSQVSRRAVLPASVELIAGEPRSAISLELCRPVAMDAARGITLGVHIVPSVVDLDALETPGPIVVEGKLPKPPTAQHGDNVAIRVDVSLMLLNRLLYAWTSSGLLADWAREGAIFARANRVLDEWTTLQIQGFRARVAPHLRYAGATNAHPWGVAISELELEIAGAGSPGKVLLAAHGTVQPQLDGPAGPLVLTGHLDGLSVGCRTQEPSGAWRVTPCIGKLLEYADVRTTLNTKIEPGAEHLPSFDVRALVLTRSQALHPGGIEIDTLAIEPVAEVPTVVRVRASVKPVQE